MAVDLNTYRWMEKLAINPIAALGKGIGKILSNTIIKPIGRGGTPILLGRTQKYGPMKGTRLRYLKDDPTDLRGYRILSGKEKLSPVQQKLVTTIQVGGKKVKALRKTRYGGVVGFGQKHPVIAGGTAVGGYYLAKNRNNFAPPQFVQRTQQMQEQLDPYYQNVGSNNTF